MANALKGKPESWVHLDKNAKAPIDRTRVVNVDQHDPSSPPLATPAYRPAPVAPPKRIDSDFEDLPGQEIKNPDEPEPTPTREQPLQPKKVDTLDHLIEQVR